jgi:hypothetical protein
MPVHPKHFHGLTHGYTSKSEGGCTDDIQTKGVCGLKRITFGPTEQSDGHSLLLRNSLMGQRNTGI